MNYNTISLFSGAMGLDLGIEKAGFHIRVCVEMDKWAAETIRNNTHIPVIEKDINSVSSDEILQVAGLKKEEVTLLVGGPPCQAFSTAGKQRGLADFRGNVILQYIRVLSDIRPPYFIMENVRGLMSAKLNDVPICYKQYEAIKSIKGSVLQFISEQFKELGYKISYALLDAANYGVPEHRERMVIIGHLGERIPLPSPTHSVDGSFGTSKWQTLREAIGDLEQMDNLRYVPLRAKSIPYMKLLKEGENWRSLPTELAREAMGKAYNLSGGKTGFLRRLKYDEPAPTLVTSPTMPATLLCHPTQLRPLSIEEYARIQQFPERWAFQGRIETIYKQIGNAVPVGLGYAVGRQVMNHIEGRIDSAAEKSNRIPYSRYKNTSDNEFSSLFEERVEYIMSKGL
ncbi:MAG: DNA cytosine methyltransferase [Bacteroides sp.]